MTTLYAKPGTTPTPRELEVARAVIAADSRAAAAANLGIAPQSIRAHLANMRIRLEARNNAELFLKLHVYLAAKKAQAGAGFPSAIR